MDLEDNVFMLPGPVKLHPRVLRAMSLPVMAHRSKDFNAVNAEIRELLKYMFQSSNDVAVISGSGTAGVEAAISSIFAPGEKVVNIMNGKFGERMGDMCKVFASSVPLKMDWGKPVDLDALAATLEQDPAIRGVTLCHNETSTGLTNQAKEIGALCRKHDKIFILDGITSVAGIPVKPDEWGADVTIVGSQKCMAAPSGLAMLSVSKRVQEQMHGKSYYLDLGKHIKKLRDGDQTPYTPAIPLFLALRESLRMIKEEGLENRFARIEGLANAARAGAAALGLELFPDPKYASNTVTAIRYPDGIKDSDFRPMLLNEHRVIIAGAQDAIKGKVFRIGTMGIVRGTDLVATFGAMEAIFKKLGYKFEPGAGVGAVSDRI